MKKKMLEKLVNLYEDITSDRPYKKQKVVAFLVYKNKILSFGVNSEKTSQYQYRMREKVKPPQTYIYDKTHAEIAAIKKIIPSFHGWPHTELFVISKKKDGNFRLARPCSICERAIREVGIKKVYYTNDYNGITKEIFI